MVWATGDGVENVVRRGITPVVPTRQFVDEVMHPTEPKHADLELARVAQASAEALPHPVGGCPAHLLPEALMSFVLYITSVMLLTMLSLNTWDVAWATLSVARQPGQELILGCGQTKEVWPQTSARHAFSHGASRAALFAPLPQVRTSYARIPSRLKMLPSFSPCWQTSGRALLLEANAATAGAGLTLVSRIALLILAITSLVIV